MFEVKANAEIKNLNCRVETHGDDLVPAIDVKLLLLGVPVDKISTLCPEIKKRFYNGPQVAVGEVNPLTVGHKVENLKVAIGDVVLNGADVKKGARIHLLPNHLANVEATVQGEHHGDTAVALLKMLRTEALTTISERQLQVAGLEQ